MHYIKPARWLVWLGLVVMLATNPATGFASSIRSGIEGCVVSGAARSIVTGEWLTSNPVQTTVSIYSARTGRLVTTVRTDADGRFRALLRPGDYRVEAPAILLWRNGISSAYVPATSVRVRVRVRQFTPVTLRYGPAVVVS